MQRVKWLIAVVLVVSLPVVVFGLTRLTKNGNSDYYSCRCIGVAADNAGVRVGGHVDSGICYGITADCVRCCRCY